MPACPSGASAGSSCRRTSRPTSLAFLARQVAESGADFSVALVNLLTAGSSDAANASFFIDGLTVLAVALVGVSCVLAAHALIASSPERTRAVR